MKGTSLQSFYDRAANGTLPAVSYIIGPTQLSEHPPYSPHDGAWLQDKITRAVLNSPKYNKTALIVSYDETGGWFDHVNPYHAPDGTPGEWLNDPYGKVGHTFAGPGFRLPFYIISPWTRNGGVYTEHADHNSQIKFIEKWQAAKGKNVQTKEMGPWRRENMGDLVNAFDFGNPDYSIPELPTAPAPHVNAKGQYDGSSFCQSRYSTTRPPVPYTGPGVIQDLTTVVEHVFKGIRGQLTEGRYLVLETKGMSLTNAGCKTTKKATVSKSTPNHEKVAHRWVAHATQVGGDVFALQSASNKQYLCKDGKFCADAASAESFQVQFVAGKGYTWKQTKGGNYLSAKGDQVDFAHDAAYWKVYSVSY
jgi:phospholipase C